MAVIKATGATYIERGQPLKCPRCDSRQAKAFKTMSRKFPKPEQTISELFNAEKYNNRVFRWENSYQCQKCGNEFVALFADDYQDILQGKSPSEAKEALKKKGFFRRLISFLFKLLLFIIAVIIGISILIGYDRF